MRGFGRVNFGLVVLDRGLRLMLLMGHRGSYRLHVLLDGGIAMLPFRKRLAGQRLEAGRKRPRCLYARFRVKFAPGFNCARGRRLAHLLGVFDGSYRRRACGEVRWLVGSEGSRRVVR